MICISVTPGSRKLAPADLLNAARYADLIELCCDRFVKTPDIGELLKCVDKPILISCRREKDGGKWTGTEDERFQLLRNAIVAEPEYIELELDVAEKIPRFGKTKRVVSFTSLNRPLANIDDIFEQAYKAKADIVKVTWPTPDMDAAWPLLSAVVQQRELPVVGMGLGRAGLTFSLMARKYGSPWVYAALERGMEAYEGQPSYWQLRNDYSWDEITPKTRFLGVVGFGGAESMTVRVLNAAFSSMKAPYRCLPMLPGDLTKFEKRLAKMKIQGLIVDPTYSEDLTGMAAPDGAAAESSGYFDLMKFKDGQWTGRAVMPEIAVRSAAERIAAGSTMSGRNVLVLGVSRLSRAITAVLLEEGAIVSLASPLDAPASRMASEIGTRHVSWNGIHDTLCDVAVIADQTIQSGTKRGELNPSFLRERMTVLDLTGFPGESELSEEAKARGCKAVSAVPVFAETLREQFRSLSGRDLPDDAFAKGLSDE